jgi:hypothetical protein
LKSKKKVRFRAFEKPNRTYAELSRRTFIMKVGMV